MSSFKSFAIVGVGLVGNPIADELLRLKQDGLVSEVVLLSRSATLNESLQSFSSRGAKIMAVDYDDAATLSAALTGVDVVISTLTHAVLDKQIPVAQAAKDRGVQLFIPSEFGFQTGTEDDVSTFTHKATIQNKLRELGVPYTLVWTGAFPKGLLGPTCGMDLLDGNITMTDSGNWPITWTDPDDIARFLVHALTTWSRDKLEWKGLRIEGERATLNEIIAGYEARTGKKVNVTRVPREDTEKKLAENESDFLSALLLRMSSSRAVIGPLESISSREWPEFNPKSVLDVMLASK